MAGIKKYYWVFLLTGGIIAIIGLFTPTAYLNIRFIYEGDYHEYDEYLWMWGLFYYNHIETGNNHDSELKFITDVPELFIPGIFSSVILGVTAILIIIVALCIWKGTWNFSTTKYGLIVLGGLFILSAHIYIVGAEMGFAAYKDRTMGVSVSFWEPRIPQFGTIAPFISGGLTLTGILIGKSLPREEAILPLEKEMLRPLIQLERASFRFCPQCGHQIVVKSSKYCNSCGYNFTRHY